jgi:HPt (histidine-containing phosphotransfer) domain-containing protein
MSNTLETVDLDVLTNLELGQVDGMDDIVVELIDLYVEDARERVRIMDEAFGRHEGSDLKQAAHSLKGSSGTVGALNMASLCHQIELAGADDWDTTQWRLRDLHVEFDEVYEVLMAERQKRTEAF